jgi:hypothetical protein
MTHTVARILAAVGLLASPMFCAQSAELGFYVGGSYGNGSKSVDKADYDQIAVGVYNAIGFVPGGNPGDNVSSIDTDNPGYGFVAGYRLFTHLAFEGGYLDLGKFRYQAQSNNGAFLQGDGSLAPGSAFLSTNSRTAGFALTALGMLPLSYRWDVYGRAGVMFSSNELTLFVTDGVRTGQDRLTGSSTDLLAGVGTGFTFAEIYTLRGEYQRVFDAGDDTVVEGDVDLVTLGVTVRF